VKKSKWLMWYICVMGQRLKERFSKRNRGKIIRFRNSKGEEILIARDKIMWLIKDDTTASNPGSAVGRSGRRPLLAFGLSFVLTGAGQVYNGEVGKGIAQFGLAIMGTLAYITSGGSNTSFRSKLNSGDVQGLSGLALALGAVAWSVIDAPASANRINRERRFANADFKIKEIRLALGRVAEQKWGVKGLSIVLKF
jgi:TM2 domain-containing membrane protein YozV